MIKSSTSSRTLAALVIATLTAASVPAFAKQSPYSPEFEAQVQSQVFSGGQVSAAKVDAILSRLEQKKSELAGIDASKVALTADKKGKAPKQKNVDKAIKKSKTLMALDAAIESARSIKTMTTIAQVCDAMATISDFEGAVRIQGTYTPGRELLATAGAVLSKWKVPKTSEAKDEASNLVDPVSGRVLSIDDITNLKAKGADLSLYEPAPGSVFYTPLKRIGTVDVRAAANGSTIPMFADLGITIPPNPTFIYDGIHASATKPKVDTKIEGVKNAKFKLKFEAEYNADPTVGALMLTMGFPSDLSHYGEHLKVVLPKGTTLHDVTRDWESYFNRDKVVHDGKIENSIESTSTDSEGRTVIVFKKGSIEVHPEAVERIGGWKYDDGDHLAKREVRGMQLVQMWLDNSDIKEFDNSKMLLRKNADGSVTRMLMNSDVGHSLGFLFLETPSLYTWNMVSSTSGSSIDFVYRNMHPVSLKNTTTLADARWAARRIAELSRSQIQTAVSLGGWPTCVQQAFVERMISRRNNLIQSLGLVGSRNNDGVVIQLLPVSNDHSKYDIENICPAVAGVPDAVDTYGFTAGSLFGPLLVQAKRAVFDAARGALSSEKRIVIASKKFKWQGPRPIGELIINISRNIERNPHPKTEQDLFLVKDRFEVGTRVGAAYGPFAAVVLRANYELAYPARSQQEAGMNNGFIVNMLLPKEAREGKLPESYVLKSEYSREFELGVDANNPAGLVTPGARAYAGEVKLWRSIYDHRDGKKIVLYRDRSDAALAELQLYVRLAIVQIPIVRSYHDWGTAQGKGLILSQAELDANPSLSKAIDRAVVDGDFTFLASREQSFFSDDDFKRSMHKWNLLLWNASTEKRLDKVELTTDKDGTRDVVQFRLSKGSALQIPLFARTERRASVEVWADPAQASKYEIQVNVMGSDVKTTDRELQDKFLHFMNGLKTGSKDIIALTPALGYTTNGSWGNLLAQSNTTYSREAMTRILSASDAQFWAALASSMNISVSTLEAMKVGDADRSKSQDGVIDHAQGFLKALVKAKAETELSKRVEKLAEAFRKALYVESKGFYSPVILGALNRIAGEDAIYSRNLITSPPPAQVNMLEDTPLFGTIGRPMKSSLKYLIFEPTTALDLFNMFDSWF